MRQIEKEFIESMSVTDDAITFIVENFDPVSYTDFTGYIMDIGVLYPKLFYKKCFCLAVARTGEFFILPFKKAKKKLTQRVLCKIIAALQETNFISPAICEPFLEFSNRYDLPINAERVHFIEDKLIKRGEK